MADEPNGSINGIRCHFSSFKIDPSPEANAYAESAFKPKMQWRGTMRGYLRKNVWPTIVRGWRFLQLKPE